MPLPSQPSPAEPIGPAAVRERAAAPDLARGAALLGIAVANSVVHLYGRERGPSYRPVEGTAADRVTDALAALLADNRGYPLFAFLLGYGTVQLANRLTDRAVPRPRVTSVLLRRAAALLAFGAVHAALLFSGDILGLYGLLALVLAAAVTASDRTLVLGAAGCLLPFTVLGVLDALAGGSAAGTSYAEPAYLTSVGLRLFEWVLSLAAAPLLGIGLLAPMLLGVLAARRRMLEDVGRHRRLLRLTAGVGVPVGVLGGVPLALTSTRVVELPAVGDAAVGALHALSGLVLALAYAALAALLGARAGRWLAPLVACGRRSLSCYLAQSVLLVPVLAPWGIGLGGRLGTAGAALLAAGAWAVTVAWATALDARGRRGPAEALLRRIVYGSVSGSSSAPLRP